MGKKEFDRRCETTSVINNFLVAYLVKTVEKANRLAGVHMCRQAYIYSRMQADKLVDKQETSEQIRLAKIWTRKQVVDWKRDRKRKKQFLSHYHRDRFSFF